MTEYRKLLPEVTPLHDPFWEALRQHELKLQKCVDCGKFRYIPTEICQYCHSQDAEWTAVSGRGEVYTFTIVRRAPTPAYQEETPYAIVHVTLPEGPRMISTIVDCPVEDVRIGMPVEVVYEDATPHQTLFRFRPV